jgi:hypothetical protein
MNDVKKLGTKILNIVVSLAVTVVFSGLNAALLPLAAQADSVCPSLNAGDMLKVTGKPAIYAVNNDLKVLYFPNGDVFKSWRPTYGGYVSVTQACFDSLQVPSTYPGAVNYHPGSYVVKRPSSDQLYVVEPGNMLAKITVDAAKALYGTNYKVMVVDDAFWPHYTMRGADITTGVAHPGMLVSNGGKTWYVNKDGKLQEVTATGMTANGFQSKFVYAVANSAVAGLTVGDQITAEVKALTDKTQSGGVVGNPNPTPATGSLTVSLASDNPFANTIVSDSSNGAQGMISVLKLNFSAGNDGDVKVTSVQLKRGGISADTDISNLYLYDDMGTKLAANPSISNGLITFTNASGLFTVTKSTVKPVWVKLDLKNNVAAGKTFSVSVPAASSIVTASGSVSGSFPLSGNMFTTALVSDLGKLAFTSSAPSANATVDPNTTGYEIWRIQVQNTAQDIEIRKLVFTVVGSVNVGDLKNFSVWDGATQIGSTVADMASDKTVTFDWSASPFVTTKGQTKILSLKADILGGTTRTFRASFQNSSDIVTYDRNYNVYLKANGTDSFTIVQPTDGTNAVNYTVNSGTLTQQLATDSPTGNIADAATNVTLGKWNWKANGEDIKVSSLNVSSTASTQSRILANVRLLVNGSQVGSTITSLTANGASNSGWGTFGNSFIIKAGTTAAITVVADTTDSSVAANDTVIVGLPLGSSNAQGVISLTSISTVLQNANTLTVKAGTVSVTKDTSFGDKSSTNPNGTVNAAGAKVGSFIITAGAGEDVDVSQVTLTETAGTCIGTYMQNLMLKDSAGKQLGATYPNPSTSCGTANTYTFNISPAARVTNGAQFAVGVYGDLKAAYTGGSALIQLSAVSATGVKTGSSASVSSQALALQVNYISTSGAYTVAIDSDTPVATNNLMGATDQILGKFNITASSTEAISITQLVVSNRVSSGATGTLKNIKLYDNDNGAVIGTAVASFDSSSATTTLVHAVFSNLSLTIPKGSSKVIQVRADISTYDDTGFTTTGQTSNLAIAKYYTGTSLAITSTGASSGVTINPNVIDSGVVVLGVNITGGNNRVAYGSTTTLYRAKLTTAWSSDTPAGAASPGSAQTVAKFVINNLSNSGNYTATVKKVDFDLSTTISQAITSNNTRTLTVYKDSLSTTALATTAAGNAVHNFQDTNITESSFTDVSISSGASKTFFVTLDTSDAASTKSLSIRIGSGDVAWTDGITSTITDMGQDLPLQYKTFTY